MVTLLDASTAMAFRTLAFGPAVDGKTQPRINRQDTLLAT